MRAIPLNPVLLRRFWEAVTMKVLERKIKMYVGDSMEKQTGARGEGGGREQEEQEEKQVVVVERGGGRHGGVCGNFRKRRELSCVNQCIHNIKTQK